MPDTATLRLIPVAPQRHEGLTVFPLVSEKPVELPYQLLGDAIANETLKIREVGSGTVPELLATNTGDVDVLVLDGEQMLGAKQNRMTSRTFILPGKSSTHIPVSCMEQGRWHFTSEHFSAAPYHSPSGVRKKVRHLEANLAKAGAGASATELGQAQGEVWAKIGSYERGLGVRSRTAALDDVYEGVRPRIEDWVAYFPGVESQVGLIVFVDERPLGMDVVGGGRLYARLHERLLRGYLLDALEAVEASRRNEGRDRPSDQAQLEVDALPEAAPGNESLGESRPIVDEGAVDEAAALRFLDRAQKAVRTPAPTVGRGVYCVLSETVVGGELLDGERLAHRSAFPDESEPGKNRATGGGEAGSGRARARSEGFGGYAEGQPIAGPHRRRYRR